MLHQNNYFMLTLNEEIVNKIAEVDNTMSETVFCSFF